MKYIVLERIVCQRPPEVYRAESSYVSAKHMELLLANSRRTWDDIEMVYQLCEYRTSTQRKKHKDFEVVGLYLQGKPGKNDYKYMEGLSFLVPVRNVHKEIMEFFEGGLCK